MLLRVRMLLLRSYISAHLEGLGQARVTLDFAGSCHAAGEHATGIVCPLKALNPAAEPRDGAFGDGRQIFGRACHQVDVGEAVVAAKQRVESVEERFELTAHFVVVDWSGEAYYIGIVEFRHDLGNIVAEYAFPCFLTFETADAEADFLAVEGDQLHVVSGLAGALRESLREFVGIAHAAQAGGYYQYFFSYGLCGLLCLFVRTMQRYIMTERCGIPR